MSRNRALAAQQSSDLQSPGLLARLPIIGILMVLIGGSIFGALSYNVQTHGPLLQWDAPLAKEFHTEAVATPARIVEFIIFGFFVGKELLQVIVVILSLYFIYKKLWAELSMLLVGSGGGAIIWYSIIPIFNRTRPAEQIGIVVHDPSFPSGHTISAVLCYGLLAYLLVPKMPNLFWKWVVVLGAILTMAFIGFSRVFLGGHYLTDVVAGYALGIAWAGLVYTLIESLFLKRRSTTR